MHLSSGLITTIPQRLACTPSPALLKLRLVTAKRWKLISKCSAGRGDGVGKAQLRSRKTCQIVLNERNESRLKIKNEMAGKRHRPRGRGGERRAEQLQRQLDWRPAEVQHYPRYRRSLGATACGVARIMIASFGG